MRVRVLIGAVVMSAVTTVGGSGQSLSSQEKQTGETCLIPEVRTLAALHSGLSRFEASRPSDPDGRCAYALLLERSGQMDTARKVVDGILTEQPRRLDALLLLHRIENRQGRRDADSVLARAARVGPNDVRVRLLQAEGEKGKERDVKLEALVRDHPSDADAWAAAAGRRLARHQVDSARAALDRALELDSLNVNAWLALARVDEDAKADSLARRDLARAVFVDSLSAEAHLALAGRFRSDGDVQSAFEQLVSVLKFDPWNASANNTLGNGGSMTSWGRYPPLADSAVPSELARALDTASAHFVHREYDQADAGYRDVLARWPGYADALLGIACVHYERGEFEAARDTFGLVAQTFPGLGLAHYGVSQSLARIRERGDPEIRAAAARFDSLPVPPEPEGLRRVFPDFARVDPDLQKIILRDVAPLSHYVEVLAIGGATFELIPLNQRLWEIPYGEHNRGRRTFDLRLWDDVKGQGGFHASAGEEWVREVKEEHFNVLAHEFMHQVHSMFTEDQRKEVEALFRKAKAEHRTLDSYADYNEMEYLAQAYEAWISPRKAPGLGGTGGHTRAEVEKLDPDVVRFLEKVNDRASYRGNEIIAYRQRIRSLTGDGDLEGARRSGEEALARYGDDVQLLTALAGVARLRGDYAHAEALDQRAIASFPESIRGYLGLAEDRARGRQDHAGAGDAVERYLTVDPGSDEAWLALAGYRLAAGQYDLADRALAKADTLLGPSNPEAGYFSTLAELDLVRGDTAGARRSYDHAIRTISRSNIPGWSAIAEMALARGDVEQAVGVLATARSIDAGSPRVRELAALVGAARGRSSEAVDSLAALNREDPRRLETLTALVSLLGRMDPARARMYADSGQALIERKEPVTYTYERDRFVAHGALTAPAIERFRTVVAKIGG